MVREEGYITVQRQAPTSLTSRLKAARLHDMAARCRTQSLSKDELVMAKAFFARGGGAMLAVASGSSRSSSLGEGQRRVQDDAGLKRSGKKRPKRIDPFSPKGDPVWICPTCTTKHFRTGDTFCRSCEEPRPPPPPPSEETKKPPAAQEAVQSDFLERIAASLKEIKGLLAQAGMEPAHAVPPCVGAALTEVSQLCAKAKGQQAAKLESDKHLELTKAAAAAEKKLREEEKRLEGLRERRSRLDEEIEACAKAVECLQAKFTKAQEEISRDAWAARPAAEAAPGAAPAASGAAGPTAWMAYQQDCTPTCIEAAYTVYLAQAEAAGAAQEDRAVWVAKYMME